ASFRGAVMTMDNLGESASHIDLKESESPAVRLDELQVAAPAGAIQLSERHVDLQPHERVLISAERGAARTLLFRAMIGLWPWGKGRITRPARAAIMFLPGRAYVPPGSLRAALCYPCTTDEFDDAASARALTAVGLERLQPLLDRTERWDQRLNDDEKQCLAIARVILQRPRWVVLDGALELLDGASRQRVKALFTSELASIGLINIATSGQPEEFFTRRVQLETDPQGPTFSPSDRAAILMT
ncbi:MAG TPA: hypothetical protein VI195_01860, partial [Steroidobacteraceae bacterium]